MKLVINKYMFQSAKIKLTFWYLLIIMLISIFFSTSFYNVVIHDIHRIITRIKVEKERGEIEFFRNNRPSFISPGLSIKELQEAETRLQITLIMVNGLIFILAGAASYFLAGRTLRPIKIMLDEQNQFISDASHELRTPIATLRAEMESNLLEKNITDKKARQLINSNLEELSTLQSLSNNLLILAENNKNINHFNFDKLNISEIITSAFHKIKPIAKKKQISFDIKLKNNFINGDKNSLSELFVILFDNAIKYSQPKTKVIVRSSQSKGKILISVVDRGIGIAKEDLAHIFERFYRADKSRSQVNGHGLGLAIADKIIKAHQGNIIVNSELGKGTTFIIEISKTS